MRRKSLLWCVKRNATIVHDRGELTDFQKYGTSGTLDRRSNMLLIVPKLIRKLYSRAPIGLLDIVHKSSLDQLRFTSTLQGHARGTRRMANGVQHGRACPSYTQSPMKQGRLMCKRATE